MNISRPSGTSRLISPPNACPSRAAPQTRAASRVAEAWSGDRYVQRNLPALAGSGSPAPRARRLTFAEKMSGTASIDGKETRWAVRLKVAIDDLDRWMREPRHAARIGGTMEFDGQTLPIEGELAVMMRGDARRGQAGRFLRYHFATPEGVEPRYRFVGAKRVHDDAGFDLLADMTTLRGHLTHSAEHADGIEAALYEPSAELRFRWWNPWVTLPFFASLRAPGSTSLKESLRAKLDFLKIIWRGVRAEF